MAGGKFLLTMTGTKQGKIKGSSTKKEGDLDYSTGMECHGYRYSVITQLDPQSGASSGSRKHQPITITKEVDSASPNLYQALCANEVFKTVKLEFGKPGSGGESVPIRIIELTNGSIIDIRQAPSAGGKRCEYVILAYEGLLVNETPHAVIPHYS